jgi:hypothetical protein
MRKSRRPMLFSRCRRRSSCLDLLDPPAEKTELVHWQSPAVSAKCSETDHG